MTQQVLYHTATARVLQWQDTDQFNYGAAPSDTATLDATPAEWAKQDGNWYVVNGGLTQANPYAPTAAQLLNRAQTIQKALVTKGYTAAITTNVAYTTVAGVVSTYQADANSQQILVRALQSYRVAGAVPSGFYWRSADNTNVPFTLADLEGLDAAMMAQGWAAFQQLTTLKADIDAATTVSAVTAIVW